MIYALRLVAWFFVSSVLGWCLDTFFRSVRRKRWAPIRPLPFAPSWGVCSLALLYAPDWVFAAPWWMKWLFFAVCFSTLEYTLGALYFHIGGKRLWDYRDRYLNLHGHADAWHTFLWGFVGLALLSGPTQAVSAWLGLDGGMPEGWIAEWGLASFLVAATVVTAAMLAGARSVRSAVVLLAVYLPQAALLIWMSDAFPGWVHIGLGLAYGVIMAHRITTYAFPIRPAPWHIAYIAPMHTFQTSLFAWMLLWPLSRLLPASPTLDWAVLLGTLMAALIAMWSTYRAPRLVEVDLPTQGFGALKVVQISDLHVGPYMTTAHTVALAHRVNALKPDLIALTGDMLTLQYETEAAPFIALLDTLEAPPHGIFAVSGNHDLDAWEGHSADMRERGVQVLEDEAVRLDLPGGSAQVVGLHYRWPWETVDYVARLEALTDPTRPTLLLCHDPQVFRRLGDRWSGVMLAGHFHGGQIGLTSLGLHVSVLRLLGLYDQGVFTRGERLLYAHRGTGTYGLPVRVGVPQEIAALRLA